MKNTVDGTPGRKGKYSKTGYNSPIDAALDVIAGKYKVSILYNLRSGVLRFGELRRVMPKATQHMVTHQLRELERDGMIHREIHREIPPRVEYSLTTEGKTLIPVLVCLCNWGRLRLQRQV